MLHDQRGTRSDSAPVTPFDGSPIQAMVGRLDLHHSLSRPHGDIIQLIGAIGRPQYWSRRIMELVLFVVVAIGLYFLSDQLLRLAERRAGRQFEYRTIYFFLILLALALLSFNIIGRLLAA
jgi:hypothetical protein